MGIFLLLILPFIIICFPIIGYLFFYFLDKKRTRKRVLLSGLFFLIVGLITPLIATIVSIKGIIYDEPIGEPACATGAGAFAFFGYIFTLFGIPFFTVILFFSTKKKPNQKTSTLNQN